jgi:hypothetical protein
MDIICERCGRRMDICSRCESLLSDTLLGDGWRSVEKELPDDTGKYITINKSGIIKIMSFRPIVNEFISDTGSGISDLFVTYWRPLPDPPTMDVKSDRESL